MDTKSIIKQLPFNGIAYGTYLVRHFRNKLVEIGEWFVDVNDMSPIPLLVLQILDFADRLNRFQSGGLYRMRCEGNGEAYRGKLTVVGKKLSISANSSETGSSTS